MIKICEVCGEMYSASYADQKYCSRKCNQIKQTQRRREKAAAVEREWKKEKPCKICGKLFVPRIVNQLCCSSECSSANSNNFNTINSKKRSEEKKEKVMREEPKQKIRKVRTQKPLSMSEINKRAREEHLTYGQYCGKYGL